MNEYTSKKNKNNLILTIFQNEFQNKNIEKC